VDGALAQRFHLIRSEAENKLTESQRTKRDEIEHAVIQYREKKGKVPDDEYYANLEKMLLDLARLYETNSTPPNAAEVIPPQ